MSMFCYQCQETARGAGCTVKGVCGKTEDVSNLQDLLVYMSKGVSFFAHIAHQHTIPCEQADTYVFEALFMTITNANFDDSKIIEKIKEGQRVREQVKNLLESHGVVISQNLPKEATLMSKSDEQIIAQSLLVSLLNEQNEDIRSLKSLILFGVKGMAAYVEHAHNLGKRKKSSFAFMHKALAETTRTDITIDELVALTLECGSYGVEVMELLDSANTSAYRNPVITKVNIGVRHNPAILISGHDLKVMEELLQ